MNNTKALTLILQIEKALVTLRAELEGAKRSGSVHEKAVRSKGTSKSKKKEGCTKRIETLIDAGFLRQPKTDLEVIAALKKKALTFSRVDVAVTLMRFVRKGKLEREGDGTKGKPWRYKKI